MLTKSSISRWALLGLAGICLGLLVCACTSKPRGSSKERRCIHSTDCDAGEYCSRSLCVNGEFVPPDDDPGGGGDDPGGGGDDPGGGGDDDPVLPPEEPCGGPCPGLMTCNEETDVCAEPPLCVSDEDCRPVRQCHVGRCRQAEPPECESAGARADCADGFLCREGSCSECEDGDCPGAQSCVGGVCEEASPCTVDADCFADRVCAAGSCTQPACSDDALEDNDALTSPFDLSTLPQWSGGAADFSFVVCSGDQDVFAVPAQPGDGAIVTASYPSRSGRLEVRLLSGGGTVLARAAPGTDVRVRLLLLLEEAPDDGVFLVTSADEGDQVAVDAGVSVLPGGFCEDDALEPNDTGVGAVELPRDPVASYALRVCRGDEDWLMVPISAGKALDATVETSEGAVVAVDVYETGLAAEDRVLRDTTPNSLKVLHYAAAAAADYYVRLYQLDASSKSTVTVTFSTQ